MGDGGCTFVILQYMYAVKAVFFLPDGVMEEQSSSLSSNIKKTRTVEEREKHREEKEGQDQLSLYED